MDDSERVAVMLAEFKEYFLSDEGKKLRSKAKSTLAEEGQLCYKQCDFEGALEKFCKYTAAALLDKTVDREVEASLWANLGSCLHHLDEIELAKVRSAGLRDRSTLAPPAVPEEAVAPSEPLTRRLCRVPRLAEVLHKGPGGLRDVLLHAAPDLAAVR